MTSIQSMTVKSKFTLECWKVALDRRAQRKNGPEQTICTHKSENTIDSKRKDVDRVKRLQFKVLIGKEKPSVRADEPRKLSSQEAETLEDPLRSTTTKTRQSLSVLFLG